MAMRTITLKLHNPSKRKCNIIEQAMYNYSRAYQYLLDKAYAHIEEIRSTYKDDRGNYRANRVAKWVDKQLSKELNQFDIQPFKDSLKIDFGMTLASYLSLTEIQPYANYPIAYLSEHEWCNRYDSLLEQLANGKQTLKECEKQMNKMSQKSPSLKPIFFCRYDVKRDYCLLYDDKNDKYYAKLYLMNVKDDDRQIVYNTGNKELKYIHKNHTVLENTGRKERFLLVPLAFGKWQEKYLRSALQHPETLKTARLIKKKNNYFLSINIDIGEAETIKPITFLGVSRGIKSPVDYTVVDDRNNIRSNGAIVRAEKSVAHNNYHSVSIQEVHKIANEIVEIAYQERAQVIMQALIDKGDRLQWTDNDGTQYVPLLSTYRYNQLVRILEYKLTEKGLPPPIKVSPVGIFYTCPTCGVHTRRNRFSHDMFICVACGTTIDIEGLGSLNLAKRLNQHNQGTVKIKLERTAKGIKFINDILELDYVPSNPNYCMDEFWDEIQNLVQDFHQNIDKEMRHKNFKKKYNLIKKIENAKDLHGLIQIV